MRFNVGFIIRTANKEDCPDITQLTNELGYPSSEEKVGEILDVVLKHEDHQLFVAEIDKQLVAYIHLVSSIRLGSDPFVEVVAFVVHSNFRNKGLGKSLINETEKWVRAKNVKNIRIRSNIIRQEAHKFFTERGFTNLKTQEVFLKQIPNVDNTQI